MNKKTLIVTACSVAIFLVALFVFRSMNKTEIINTPSAGQSIVAFGDSLVRGVGSSEGGDFVSLVSAKIGRPIQNLGVPGDTTRDGLARLDNVLAENPDTVIVLLGGNDYLKRIPREETFANLNTIVRRLQDSGAAVLVLGVRGGALRDSYENDYADLARRTSTGYVSNVLDGLLGNRELMSDQIHPNDAGYAIIAGRVAPVLLEMFGK
jgi:acyl-CoA thioesterase-1